MRFTNFSSSTRTECRAAIHAVISAGNTTIGYHSDRHFVVDVTIRLQLKSLQESVSRQSSTFSEIRRSAADFVFFFLTSTENLLFAKKKVYDNARHEKKT